MASNTSDSNDETGCDGVEASSVALILLLAVIVLVAVGAAGSRASLLCPGKLAAKSAVCRHELRDVADLVLVPRAELVDVGGVLLGHSAGDVGEFAAVGEGGELSLASDEADERSLRSGDIGQLGEEVLSERCTFFGITLFDRA
ncbi:hypothetical protein HG531_008861 [Fusarium graminearum]|nr:hypothetical protein HG531_008861 [Fusarium graminearum]